MSERERLDILSNASATSDYFTAKVGGTYLWSIEGTFNGGSYQLQLKNANGTATDIPGASMSAAGFMQVDLPPSGQVRAVETGATSAMYSTLVLLPAAIGTSDNDIVGGPAADDAAASGNPVPVGGIYNSTRPTYTNLDRTQAQSDTRGNIGVNIASANSVNFQTQTVRTADGVAGNAVNNMDVNATMWARNGAATFDLVRNNQDLTIFASAARTATPTPFDGVNYDGKSLHLVIDCTAITSSPSVVFTLQGKDAVSGKFYTILASAAIVGTGTTVLRVGPGLTAAANLVANDVLPRSYRVIATHGNADSITYSVGMSIVNG